MDSGNRGGGVKLLLFALITALLLWRLWRPGVALGRATLTWMSKPEGEAGINTCTCHACVTQVADPGNTGDHKTEIDRETWAARLSAVLTRSALWVAIQLLCLCLCTMLELLTAFPSPATPPTLCLQVTAPLFRRLTSFILDWNRGKYSDESPDICQHKLQAITRPLLRTDVYYCQLMCFWSTVSNAADTVIWFTQLADNFSAK